VLQNVSAEIRECLERAADCVRQAELERDPKLRQDFLDLARRWRKLADSYEFASRLETFSKYVKRPGQK
jgi:hypothetical protein